MKDPFPVDCQLQVLAEAGQELSLAERLGRRARKLPAYLKMRIHQVASNAGHAPTLGDKTASPPAKPVVLGLKPGEKVRVKSAEAIRRSLDGWGRCEGLGYMPSVMDPYCGGTYKVLKRVETFFDERAWRLLKVKNVVILEGVTCESTPDTLGRWAGCQRTCFLFWKEAWLERLEP